MKMAPQQDPITSSTFSPSGWKKYLKWAVVAIVGAVLTSVTVSIVVFYLLLKYLISPAVSSLPDVARQGEQWLQNGREQLEQRLKTDEDRIKQLEDQVKQLQTEKNRQ